MQTKSTDNTSTEPGIIKISGSHAKQFLQGQLTCNVDDVTPTQSLLGAHCNPQGRIISLFTLFQHEEDYFLEMPCTMIPIALSALKKYAVFFKTALEEIVDKDLQKTISRSQKNWHQLNIAKGIPTIFPETSGKFLPHEINLPALHAVSFSKGCYTGQEIIARMQYRGKLKTRLVQAKIITTLPVERGADIYNSNQICGSIVDYHSSDNHHYDLLIIIPEKETAAPFTLHPEQPSVLEITR